MLIMRNTSAQFFFVKLSLTFPISALFCSEEKVQPRFILTRCSSWYFANECLARSKVGPWWTFNIFWSAQHICTLLYVLLLYDGCNGTTISKVYLVETTYDQFANDPVCWHFCPRQSTLDS